MKNQGKVDPNQKKSPSKSPSQLSLSASNAKFFQKFQQMVFYSSDYKKALQPTSTPKDANEKNLKAFQIEIERRFQKTLLRRNYTFPRHHLDIYSHSRSSSSSDRSLDSLKEATRYDLYSQNIAAGKSHINPMIRSNVIREGILNLGALDPKNNSSIHLRKLWMERKKRPKTGEENDKNDSSIKDSTPKASLSLSESLAHLMTRQQKCIEILRDLTQQNTSKTWFGEKDKASNICANKKLCPNSLDQGRSFFSNDQSKIVNKSQSLPYQKSRRDKDISDIGKSSCLLRQTLKQQQYTSTPAEPGKSYDKSMSRGTLTVSFGKTQRNIDYSENYRTFMGWDVSQKTQGKDNNTSFVPRAWQAFLPRSESNLQNMRRVSEKEKLNLTSVKEHKELNLEDLKKEKVVKNRMIKRNNIRSLNIGNIQTKVNEKKMMNSYCHSSSLDIQKSSNFTVDVISTEDCLKDGKAEVNSGQESQKQIGFSSSNKNLRQIINQMKAYATKQKKSIFNLPKDAGKKETKINSSSNKASKKKEDFQDLLNLSISKPTRLYSLFKDKGNTPGSKNKILSNKTFSRSPHV